ncbi:MAG: outer membrane lipoprotein-sorting protein [Candidatus Raymondbacteria bacterium RifOxyA12_full_50_37]|uniref:Outer membrane lipoprotein-sorting protein n=1 Tax=Candidatus Raymondbacteria bacterium RIFOXYD12_FULL_49_13 TaxID=1817890 RepID=A0A1F7FEE9_UNCRA|nr:MAG: outer membrane lipoprotein-sorting protein [Candidatus Raymondbacteria bacterium RifOxyB12_full_50_8]OGJ89775.1 MAG: outer membrane lipoprotein-sorting protein [Candidatus Raymondbacteria bacterium RifOxyA12_full_50_37]OGJ91183.1 MAG: outer membrane lipoprotein-sorting protein [Candidatus Raymondbacteria bacterium RIFOXYA2_FULL_49_16]OGJ96316.1 MAG: outer membrane lipoprotein-sorting protein [Candidatus Raymondbacteria bacterium RifOxyC12_full_50_8]OGJ97581.1 MAG: outer membrane lipopro
MIQRYAITIIAVLLPAILIFAEDPAALLQKIDRNLEPDSYEMYRKLINVEPDGKKKEFLLYMVRKGNDKVAGVFLSPPADKDRSMLRLGDNMWLYIPNVGKPVRITSLQSATGGVFNNADILRIDFSAEYEVAQMLDTAGTYLFTLKARTRSVAYDRLRLWAAKKELLPIKIECMTEAGMLIKTLYFKETKDFGAGIKRPSVIETDSPLYKGYKSIMVYAKIKRKKFSDEVFSINYMSKIGELRE